MRSLRLGTRGSALALWQANRVRDALLRVRPGLQVSLRVIRTKGDAPGAAKLPFGEGLFTSEIEHALLAKNVDLAVHSLKDLPVRLPEGLVLAAVPVREDPADALVAGEGVTLAALPHGARVLTGSPRRRAQLLHRRPDLRIEPVRGSVPTRLRKLDRSGAHGLVLAIAGLVRLGVGNRVSERLDPAEFLPACGQGALAVEVKSGDNEIIGLCQAIDNSQARAATAAERAFLAVIGAGCQVPVGSYARHERPGELTITGMVGSWDGSRVLGTSARGPARDLDEAAALGRSLAEGLIREGAGEIAQEARGQAGRLMGWEP